MSNQLVVETHLPPGIELPEYFSTEEWLALFSVLSAIIQPVNPDSRALSCSPAHSQSSATSAQVTSFLNYSASIDNAPYRNYLVAILQNVSPTVRPKIKFMLSLLTKQGFFPYFLLWSKSGGVPFYKKPLEERTELLKQWIGIAPDYENSYVFFPPMRKFAISMAKIAIICWHRLQTRVEAEMKAGHAMLYGPIVYDDGRCHGRIPCDGTDSGTKKAQRRNIPRQRTDGMGDGAFEFEFLDLTEERTEEAIKIEWREAFPDTGFPGLGPKHTTRTEYGTWSGSCDKIKGNPKAKEEEWRVIETEVVIVGSGCGGAAVAKRAAEGYLKCIVVDKGDWFPNSEFPLNDGEAPRKLFERGLALQNEDQDIGLAAGSTWGGGGTVNWSICLQTQGHVRAEWADKHGLKYFLSDDYQARMDSIFDRLGATIQTQHNCRNKILLEGSRRLGYHAGPLFQNTGGLTHYDETCGAGCSGEHGWKLGVAQTYLPDAARSGAEFIKGFTCTRILFSSSPPIAKGIEGTWSPFPHNALAPKVNVRILAKKVVVSAGAINTPALLLRSGLTNPNIGKSLHIHPTIMAHGVFEQATKPYGGSCTTTACTQFENLDGEGYGVIIEAANMMSFLSFPAMPWSGPEVWKKAVLEYKDTVTLFALARDKYGGSVAVDEVGMPVVNYTVSDHDKRHLLEGVIAICKILYVQGAKEIFINIWGYERFVRPSDDGASVKSASKLEPENGLPGILDPAFQSFLVKLRGRFLSLPRGKIYFTSGHQLSSCRMGVDSSNSVVDGKGMVWGIEGLYIADGSVLPGACGVNPMVTIIAISDWVGHCLVEDLRRGVEGVETRREEWMAWRRITVEKAKSKMVERYGEGIFGGGLRS